MALLLPIQVPNKFDESGCSMPGTPRGSLMISTLTAPLARDLNVSRPLTVDKTQAIVHFAHLIAQQLGLPHVNAGRQRKNKVEKFEIWTFY